MLVDTFANRLRKALNNANLTQSQLAEKTKIDKSLISNYLSGNYNAKQDKLSLISNVLGVTETWLMGYDVPMYEFEDKSFNDDLKQMSELDELLFSKAKELSDEDKKMVINIINAIKRDVDKEDSI